MARLRERISQLEDDNVTLEKLKIEQENELSVWMEKAQRLREEVRILEEENMREEKPPHAHDHALHKELAILQEQLKQLAASKVQLEDMLNQERQRFRELQFQLRQADSNQFEVKEMQSRLIEAEELLMKTRSAYERSETKVTRNEVYISQL
jgi:hypothetical protein